MNQKIILELILVQCIACMGLTSSALARAARAAQLVRKLASSASKHRYGLLLPQIKVFVDTSVCLLILDRGAYKVWHTHTHTTAHKRRGLPAELNAPYQLNQMTLL